MPLQAHPYQPLSATANSARRSPDVSPLPNSPIRDIASQNATRSCSSTSAGRQRWPFFAALYPLWSPVLGQLVPIPVRSTASRSSWWIQQKHRNETMATAVGGGRSSRPHWKNSRTAAHWATKQGKEKLCSRRPKNRVGKETAPSQPEDR